MPILGTLLVGLFTQLATFLAQMFGKKVAIATAFVASLGVVVGAVLAILSVVIAPLASAIFAAYPYAGWMGLAFPSPATGVCFSALSATWAATVLYGWQREALRIAASV